MENILYHCTDYLSLKSILKSQYFRPSYCLEKCPIIGICEGDTMAFPMVCFADFSDKKLLHAHALNYKKECYIALSQDWAKNKKVSPVTYLQNGMFSEHLFRKILSSLLTNSKDVEGGVKLYNIAYMYLGYLRKYEGVYYNKAKRQWSSTIVKFYDEREWRYIPIVKHNEHYSLFESEYRDPIFLEKCTKEIQKKEYLLNFSWDDIIQIGVPADKKKGLIELLHNIFSSVNENNIEAKLNEFE